MKIFHCIKLVQNVLQYFDFFDGDGFLFAIISILMIDLKFNFMQIIFNMSRK